MFESQIQTTDTFTTWFTTQAIIDTDNATAVIDHIYQIYPDEPSINYPYRSNYTATSGEFTHTTFH